MRHLCEHTSLPHLTTSMKYTCSLYIGINVLLGFSHIIWACGLSKSAANGRDFTVYSLPKLHKLSGTSNHNDLIMSMLEFHSILIRNAANDDNKHSEE